MSVYNVMVTPVVAYLDDVSVLEGLCAAPSEVAHIFEPPLEALLDPELAAGEGLVPLGSDNWPYEAGLHVGHLRFSSRICLQGVPCADIFIFTYLKKNRTLQTPRG